ncbi:PilN domain-containing protein [Nitrincola nitratireducens]|uniref:Uncharacterized protein n=1 Tax=Nitrincola nitratireducens TaxID=1229521 RepID=W9V4C9_9GAMM|nr:PilN domain-containing protein [Nitrincola nitratireducens]EXJ11796.1 hypothetical protein D791_01169 [Nitrincola nitratireducens]
MLKLEPKLFGLDLSHSGRWLRHWNARVWWQQDAWMRAYLDVPVLLQDPEHQTHYWVIKGAAIPAPLPMPKNPVEGILLPEEVCLVKRLHYPRHLQGELDSIIENELKYSSPFLEEDTCWTYRITQTDKTFTLTLVMASIAQIHAFCLDRTVSTTSNHEVWCQVDGHFLCFSHFKHPERERQYQKRVSTFKACGVYILVMLVLLPLLPLGVKHKQLQRIEGQAQLFQAQAQGSIAARNQMLAYQAGLAEVSAMDVTLPAPLFHLSELSRLLDDSVWLTHIELTASGIRIEGRAPDASRVMALLSASETYAQVRAPSPIVRDNAGYERFLLDVAPRSGL